MKYFIVLSIFLIATQASATYLNSMYIADPNSSNFAAVNSSSELETFIGSDSNVCKESGGNLAEVVAELAGTIATSRTWTLNSATDSVTIAGSIVASNPSVGSNGSAAPTSSTLAGAKDGSGNLQPLNYTASGGLKVDGSSVTQPVSGTFWQATQPVSGTFWQATQPVSGSLGRTWSLLNTTDSVNVGNFPSSYPVTGTFWQSTQPISAASLPLPANAAQETGGHLASIDTKITTTANGIKTDGSAVTQPISAASLPLPSGASTSALQSSTITALGSPFQAGGSIGNTVFGATQSGAWSTGRTWSLLNTTDSVNAVQSGTWNLNNISGTISLPTGAATSANQSTSNTTLSTIAANQTNASQKTQVVDGSGTVQGPMVGISGTNYAPVTVAASGIAGSAVPARTIQVGGSDGTNLRTLLTDSSGVVQTSLGNTAKTIKFATGNLSSSTTSSGQTVVTYTVTAGKTFYLEEADCQVLLNSAAATQEQFGTCQLLINGAQVWQHFFKGPGSGSFNPILAYSEPIPVAAGEVVTWQATPAATTNFLWYGNIGGYEK